MMNIRLMRIAMVVVVRAPMMLPILIAIPVVVPII
jgi:hypothetical protein